MFDCPDEFVNLTDYPIADSSSASFRRLLASCQQNYTNLGLCELPNFIRPEAMEILAAEAARDSAHAYYCKNTHNAYLTSHDADLDDALDQLQEHTFVGSVPYDRLTKTGRLRQLYLWEPLKRFIGEVLGKRSFHRFADPLGACSVNVFVDGGEHGWHFDESEFTITLMLQAPSEGGAFEYVPMIRGREDEKQIVRKVLHGERDRVKRLPFAPGTLLIFAGRQTLHRVTRVVGDIPRLVPVLCYSELPNATNSQAVRQLFWGRAG